MYGAVTQLASGTLDPSAAAVELATLSHGLDVMIGVTNDLLDAEALRLGRLRVHATPTNLRECVQKCIPPARGAGGASVHLDVALDVPCSVVLDPLRLRQVCVCMCMRMSTVCRCSGFLQCAADFA
jgi:signal transduction histidine kinase